MKLPQLNENSNRLHVYIRGSIYAYPMYRDFGSKKELDEYVKNEFYATSKQYDYFYGDD